MGNRYQKLWLAVGCLLLTSACAITYVPPSGPPTIPQPERTPPVDDPTAVRPEPGPLTVWAWAEPAELRPGGGQAHILVRVQRPGGQPAVGVEVRLGTSRGSLYSRGRILRTDAQGRTRDRLTTRRTAEVTVNAGGTRRRFVVTVLAPEQTQSSRDQVVEPSTPWSRLASSHPGVAATRPLS